MSKKKGMFGWLGFGQKEQQNTEEVHADNPAVDKAEQVDSQHLTDEHLPEQATLWGNRPGTVLVCMFGRSPDRPSLYVRTVPGQYKLPCRVGHLEF